MAENTIIDDRLGSLRLSKIVQEDTNIIDASIDLAIGEASQLDLTLADPDGVIINGPGTRLGAVIGWGALDFAIASIEHSPIDGVRCTKIQARAAGWQGLKKRKGPKTWRGLSASGVVRSECKAAGITKVIAQRTQPGKTISRLAEGADPKSTSDLEMFDRLAGQSGFVFGEAGGIFYFGAPSWLVKQPGFVVNATADYLAEYPTLRKTSDDKDRPATVTLRVSDPEQRSLIMPFASVRLTGVPGRFAGRYLVERVSIPLTSADPATIELVTPVDPEKQK